MKKILLGLGCGCLTFMVVVTILAIGFLTLFLNFVYN